MPGSPSSTISRSLLKFMSIQSVILSNHLILCHPLLLLYSNLSSIRVFPSESALRIRWPKYWGFSFSIGPSSEYSGWTSFRMDWLDLLAVQGRLTYRETRPISLMSGMPAQTSLVNPVSASGCLTHIVDFKNVSEDLIHPFILPCSLVLLFMFLFLCHLHETWGRKRLKPGIPFIPAFAK